MSDRFLAERGRGCEVLRHLGTGALFDRMSFGDSAGRPVCIRPGSVAAISRMSLYPSLTKVRGARVIDRSADPRYAEHVSDGSTWLPVVVPATGRQAAAWGSLGTPTLGDERRVTGVGNQPTLLVIGDGTRWQPQGGQHLIHQLRDEVVSASSTSVTVALPDVTIPAGMLGLYGGLMVEIAAELSGTPLTRSISLSLGGQSLPAVTSNGTDRAVYMARHVRNNGSASSQRWAEPSGNYPVWGAYGTSNLNGATTTVDTAAAAVLSGSISWTSSAAQVGRLASYRVWWIGE